MLVTQYFQCYHVNMICCVWITLPRSYCRLFSKNSNYPPVQQMICQIIRADLQCFSYMRHYFECFLCVNTDNGHNQLSSVTQPSLTVIPWTVACQAPLSIINYQSLLKLMSIALVMPPNHLILCYPLLLPSPIFPSIRVFSNKSVLRIRQPKFGNYSFIISPSNEYSRLISFRMVQLDLLAVQGTLKTLLQQHHSSKASILWRSAFFIVQLSHPYMTTGKTIAFTRWTFVGKVMSLLFNMLSRLVIAFLPRSKCLNFMAAVTIYSDFRTPQNKVSHCFHYFPIYLPRSDGTGCRDLSSEC